MTRVHTLVLTLIIGGFCVLPLMLFDKHALGLRGDRPCWAPIVAIAAVTSVLAGMLLAASSRPTATG